MQSRAATTVCHAPAHDAVAYARRQPEATLLYKTLQAHWLGFRATIETDGGELPAFVGDEFEAYFRCGILAMASCGCDARTAGIACAAWDELRNCIYARYGRPFKAPEWRKIFEQAPWYKADPNYTDDRLSPAAKANVRRLIDLKKERYHCQ
jgi:hypothetical protein